ncbi:GSCOCG00009051001-RA-CDS [Cotesia congregata]|nr:GSCOCG00009051001-RA-CDS [Cotesia congregata]
MINTFYSGTRWCGDGNKASNYEELGLFKHTDACCRQHDNCPLGIGSGKSLGLLLNNAGFTRYLSWCACDQDFYNCLKAANNPVAREIGVTYFTVLAPQCIDYNYPAKCTNLTR